MFKKAILATTLAAFGLAGCAEKSENVQAAYVSPLGFQSMSCAQIGQEATRVSARVAEVSGVQDKNAQNDAVATGVALVLFWPAAFFIKGNKENVAELARLKGEIEALEQASNSKNCGIEFKRAAPSEEA